MCFSHDVDEHLEDSEEKRETGGVEGVGETLDEMGYRHGLNEGRRFVCRPTSLMIGDSNGESWLTVV